MVLVVVLRVLVLVMELMVSWGESQSWNTWVVAMLDLRSRSPLRLSQLKLHFGEEIIYNNNNRNPFTESHDTRLLELFELDAIEEHFRSTLDPN